MRRYWGSDLRTKRRDKVKGGSPRKGWDQRCGTEVRRIDGGRREYFLGEDVWIGNDDGGEGWFLLLYEGVCNWNSADIHAETILLQRIVFVEDKEGIRYWDKGV